MGRTVAFSVLVSVVVGASFAAVVLLSSERAPVIPRVSVAWVAELVMLSLLGSLLVSVPLGVLGGVVAGRVLRGQPSLSIGTWLAKGTGIGTLLGGAGGAVYALPLAGGEYIVVGLFGVAGAICGAVSGFIVGAWCGRQRGLGVVAEA
jgi:hypothetical protein